MLRSTSRLNRDLALVSQTVGCRLGESLVPSPAALNTPVAQGPACPFGASLGRTACRVMVDSDSLHLVSSLPVYRDRTEAASRGWRSTIEIKPNMFHSLYLIVYNAYI
ncbi:hypothetical protein BJX68DRAFT_225977 [Aspergillus pseudodeflectus]|uniref:Uncharacterized protein n=1 Tax=Aspergillus pseudodeflectus TaxID=176178 RepID=A0ABR4L4T0_9EURO